MFPSILNTFSRPSATDRLNNPSHSALHNTVSSALGQVEAVIGVDGANSVLGTIIGDLRSPDSGGGGHVQSANKGGTGQTTYTKGDILVAQSTSVLSKLSVGIDGQSLVADSSVASGIKWGTPGGTKISAISSVVTYRYNNGFSNASLVSVTIPGSVLGNNSAVRLTSFARYIASGGGTGSVLLTTTYGTATISSIILRSTGNSPASSLVGKIEYTLIANGSSNSQRGIFSVSLNNRKDNWTTTSASVIGFSLYDTNVSSVESSSNQNFGINALGGSTDEIILTLDGSIVEKII